MTTAKKSNPPTLTDLLKSYRPVTQQPEGTFTIQDVAEARGFSMATAGRLVRDAVAAGHMERVGPLKREVGRSGPPRRLYRFTEAGLREAQKKQGGD